MRNVIVMTLVRLVRRLSCRWANIATVCRLKKVVDLILTASLASGTRDLGLCVPARSHSIFMALKYNQLRRSICVESGVILGKP